MAPAAHRPESPLREAENAGLLTPGGVVLWLLAAGVVGVVGSILLEGARVAAPIGLAPALIIVLPLELACYLLALGAGVPRLPPGRTTLGVFLGLVLRAALALILSMLAPSPLGGEGMRGQFLLYYARLWPTALVQLLAVTSFLWLIRDLLAVVPPPEPRPVLAPADADEGERQRQLLEALLEPSEPVVAPPLPVDSGEPQPPPPRSRRSRSPRRRVAAAQSPLLSPAPAPPPPPPEQETALALPAEPAPDDTAALPLVATPPPVAPPSPPLPPLAEEQSND